MNKRQAGAEYEARAAEWLEQQGLCILERNFYCRQGEVDLVAEDGAYLVFVEVKYRRDNRAGHPLEAVGPYKQRRLIQAAQAYCHKHQVPENRACRFDVVGILGEEILHVKNAFEVF